MKLKCVSPQVGVTWFWGFALGVTIVAVILLNNRVKELSQVVNDLLQAQ